ncbi:transposase [Verminephrobacter eiseniae]|uniref:transposase n=1 Tax=Verminephrobacter eiseniae TaxID=364317 RepID=UPI0038B34BBD
MARLACRIGQRATAVIPPRRNRVVQRSHDRHLYKERNVVERFFNRIKQFRRIATRYEKLARNYLSFLNLVCTYFWQAMQRKQMSGPHDFTHRDWIGGDRQHQRH